MDSMHLYMEYMKVLAAYFALLYVWPGIVFWKYLEGKGLTFRFLFCCTVQIVLLNGIILGLGAFHILNVWVVRGVFWGLPVLSGIMALYNLYIKNIHMAKHGWKYAIIGVFKSINRRFCKFLQIYKGRMTEYFVLIVILLFGMAYFSIGAFCDNSYGNYDLYTHFRWILKLRKGEIFPEGIYPEAMHCFIYGLRYLFGVKLHSCILFLAGIHISAFLVAAYCLLKELFQYRCVPLLILLAWLTYDSGVSGDVLDTMYLSMTRLTWTLPQEFGLYLVFLCPLFLIRFFRMEKNEFSIKRWYKIDNLFLLALGVGAAVATHFYVIILAFFVCLAVVIVYCWKMFSLKRLVPLTCAVAGGAVAGAAPMVIAYVAGTEAQDSIWWGIHRFKGISEDSVNYNAAGNDMPKKMGNVIVDFYQKGYVAIFGEHGALDWIIISGVIIAILCVYCVYRRGRQNESRQLPTEAVGGYLFMILASLISVFLYAAPYMGFPEFVAVDRIFTILKMILYSVWGVLIDLILFFKKTQKIGMRRNAVIGCMLVYCVAYFVDFHEYLFSVLKRYNAAVNVTDEIVEEYRDCSYVIVSMYDEVGQIEEEGHHEELMIFLQNLEQDEYFVPAEDVFLYIEKHPLVQGQIHYFTGPSWLASRSSLLSDNAEWKSQCPDILHTEISEEMSQQDVDYERIPWDSYLDATIRTVLCSKAYYWYQDFRRVYSGETSVYYEDDEFVCYLIHQDLDNLLNLSME